LKHQDFTFFTSDRKNFGSVKPAGLYERHMKRALDLFLSIFLLPVLIPILGILILWVRKDGGPGLFVHERVGYRGQSFKCLKIRTMVMGAEDRLDGYLNANPEASIEWSRTQKLTNDPRITDLGKFLRKTSLDELPQIWNVIKGEMSLVGPRPVTRAELQRYGSNVDLYLQLTPGVTGLWQVEGRGDGCYNERIEMDKRYTENMSIFQDILLILRTAGVVVKPTGR